MTDVPRLPFVLFLFILAAFCIATAWKLDARDSTIIAWFQLLMVLLALIFGTWAVIASADWISHHAAERRREIEAARVYGMLQVARAIEKLNTAQLELVAGQNAVAITMIAEEQGPIWLVRGMTRSIPFVFVQEFFERSVPYDPFLFPIREASNKEWAADLTNLLKARGWAADAAGTNSAKLLPGKSLAWVASRFSIELDTGEKNG